MVPPMNFSMSMSFGFDIRTATPGREPRSVGISSETGEFPLFRPTDWFHAGSAQGITAKANSLSCKAQG